MGYLYSCPSKNRRIVEFLARGQNTKNLWDPSSAPLVSRIRTYETKNSTYMKMMKYNIFTNATPWSQKTSRKNEEFFSSMENWDFLHSSNVTFDTFKRKNFFRGKHKLGPLKKILKEFQYAKIDHMKKNFHFVIEEFFSFREKQRLLSLYYLIKIAFSIFHTDSNEMSCCLY